MMQRYKIVIILFLIMGFMTYSQMPFAHILNKNNGLQSNSIYDIFQDQKGYIWLATGKGLCRYNGNEFVYFKSTIQTMKSGSCIKQDKFGRIWYANFDGFLYYVEDDVLKEFPQKTNSGFMNFGITDKFIYLPLENSIQMYDLKTFKFIKELTVNAKIKNALQVGHDFYVLTYNLIRISKGTIEHSTPFPLDTDKDFIAPILASHQNKIHIVSKFSKKYFVFNQKSFEEKPLNINTNFIQNISQTKSSLWFNTTTGAYRLNDFNHTFELLFQDYNITSVFEDKENRYWIGTQNHGVLYVPNFKTTLDITIERPSKISIKNNTTFTGNLNDEIYMENKLLYKSKGNHAVNFLSHDTLNQKLIWSSSKFYKYDLKQNKLESEIVLALKDLIQIDEKYYAFAASGSVGLMENNSQSTSVWDNVKVSSRVMFTNCINLKEKLNGKTVAKSFDGNQLYFGTNQGLFKITPHDEKEILDHGKKVYIAQLRSYKDQVYALATNDLLYTIINDKIVLNKTINNLTNNNTQKIFLCQHFLFVYTGKELYEYNLKNNNILKKFHSNESEVLDVAKNSRNQLIIITNNGKVILDENQFDYQYKPYFKLNHIDVDEKRYFTNKKEINLKPNPESIKIPFEYINFRPNDNHEIIYKINQGKWMSTPAASDNIQFSSLAPGEYDIKVKVKNYENTGQTISFIIPKPWYLSSTFLLFSGILMLFSVYQLLKWQSKRIHIRNQSLLEKIELEKNLNQSTLKAIKSQMNPHFFFNALNTIQSFILLNDKKQAINYLSKFSLLTRNILDMTEKEYISIHDEIKTLTTYLELEEVRFNEDFSFEIAVDDQIDVDNQKIPTMIIQPYVENAIKHGLLHKQGEKNLLLSFVLDKDHVKVIIEDNGVGRQKSGELNAIKNKNHKSFATKAIQNRIELINKNNENKITILYEDKTNDMFISQGTIVTINFPNNIL